MGEEEAPAALSRKEQRKLKLLEYLAAKGRLKAPNPRPYLRENQPRTRPAAPAPQVVNAKENEAPQRGVRQGGVGQKGVGQRGVSSAGSRPDPAWKVLSVSNRVTISGGAGVSHKKTNLPVSASAPAPPRRNRNPELARPAAASSRPAAAASSRPAATTASSRVTVSTRPAVSSRPAAASSRPAAAASSRPAAAASSRPAAAASSRPAAASSRPAAAVSARPVATTASSRVTVSASSRPAAILSSRPGPRPAAGVEKQLRVQPSVRAPPNAPRPSVKPKSKLSFSSKAASSCPAAAAASSRISLGPLTKTRTGLTPAVPRPRPAAPGGAPTAAASSIPAGKAAPRRPGPGLVSRPAEGGARWPLCRPHPEPTSKNRRRPGFEPAPAGGSTKPGSPAEGGAAASQTPSRPTVRAAATAGKLQTSRGTDGRQQNRAAQIPAGPPPGSQTAPQPARTISLTGRTANTRTPELTAKTAAHTDRRRPTAAQQQRLRKLQEWRQAKGISYKRPSMPAPSSVARRTTSVSQTPFWKSMKEEDEAQSLICAVDQSLADCITLLEEGCPPDRVSSVLSRLPPVSQKFTKYWICRVRLMERDGDLDVLPVFKDAVRVVMEPLDELRAVVFEILKRKKEIHAPEEEEEQSAGELGPEAGPDSAVTPRPTRALICGQNGDSAVIKYKITATPGGPPSQSREAVRVKGQEVRFFTPVRRSVRIERRSSRYPAALQDHDPCVASYHDLFGEVEGEGEGPDGGAEPAEDSCDAPMYVYRENGALEDKVVVRLVCDDSP
ncbi:cytoskeleton-associated protein 2-like isoform X2 [Salarias fasciatus]|uniref:cytoskeleton-associated protein 2-like isoform X2 n=1 Tax=Salarias fasciatus TaxID=181472 RepID=UPI001176F182|nr:cytoskeleton-associated protein 2-like isoform X2 [Salarias fasciatus]